tara:strand:+ start:2794 stop:2946 length:153 start_codon:yes stop_codon:yes gene_type:complete
MHRVLRQCPGWVIYRAGSVPENTGKCLHFLGDTGDNATAMTTIDDWKDND